MTFNFHSYKTFFNFFIKPYHLLNLFEQSNLCRFDLTNISPHFHPNGVGNKIPQRSESVPSISLDLVQSNPQHPRDFRIRSRYSELVLCFLYKLVYLLHYL